MAGDKPFFFTVSPDFSPDHISGWFIFNTWLQKELGLHVHLELYNDFASQRRDIAAGKVDLIYANPSDAALLVREQGFVGVARPVELADEAVVVVRADSPVQHVEDLAPGTRIAATDHPDVRMMGMIMLEPADLSKDNTTTREVDTYVLVAKALVTGECDVGLFLKAAYDDLSAMSRAKLRPLVTSQIYVVRHGLLVGPRLADRRDAIVGALQGMPQTPKGRDVLANLGFTAWEPFAQEDVEFMIDLMDTLVA
ncbi:MAG: phosphate/phosphite/phosphonate ABC transporter substrate-binding protein [Burkholderiales bacterium]